MKLSGAILSAVLLGTNLASASLTSPRTSCMGIPASKNGWTAGKRGPMTLADYEGDGHSNSSPALVKDLSKLSQLRGGAGPLDPTVMANVFTYIALLQGVFTSLSGETTCKQYGASMTKMNFAHMKRIGITILSIAILALCQGYFGCSVENSMALSTIPWTVEPLYAMLNNVQEEFGGQGEAFISVILSGLIPGLIMHTNFNDWASGAMTYYTCFMIVAGVTISYPVMKFSPGFAEAFWKLPKTTKDQQVTLSIFGAWLLGFGLQLYAVAHGKSYEVSTALAVVPTIVNILASMIMGDLKALGLPKGLNEFWLVFFMILAATNLL